MKKPVLLLVAVLTIGVITGLILKRGEFKKEKETGTESFVFGESDEEEEAEEETAGADRQMNMWFHNRAYPDPNNLGAKYERAWSQFQKIKKETSIKKKEKEGKTVKSKAMNKLQQYNL